MPEKDLTASEKKWHKLRLLHAQQRRFLRFFSYSISKLNASTAGLCLLYLARSNGACK
jgi:hypothetical protein